MCTTEASANQALATTAEQIAAKRAQFAAIKPAPVRARPSMYAPGLLRMLAAVRGASPLIG